MQPIAPEELAALLAIMKAQYGYDFSGYAEASMTRRVQRCASLAGDITIKDLADRISQDPEFFSWFIQMFTVNVTEMFRDPTFYAKLREKVLPVLATYPTIKIWHAGCATGEEVYSVAILLYEAGLLDRTRIYATDINPANIEKAQAGVLPINTLKEYTQNYRRAGGTGEFSEYYAARYDKAIIRKDLRESVVFSQHNLVTDGVFNEFQLVLCRNVLIYFKRDLQNRVVRLLYDSLSPLGFLALGTKESLMFSETRAQFDVVNGALKIFRRRS
jgi:chemotaxis protein methyltransferase CheR